MKVFGKEVPLSAAIGMLLVAVIAMASLCASLIAPHGETETVGDVWMMHAAVLFLWHCHGVRGRGAGTQGRPGAVEDRRHPHGDARPDLRADDPVGAGYVDAGADRHDRDSRFNARVPARAARRTGYRCTGICGSGEAARRRARVDHPPRNPAECGATFAGRIRHALRVHDPVRGGLELPRAGHPAALCRLGRHGPRQRAGDQFRRHRAAGAGRGDCAADDRYQSDRRLAVVGAGSRAGGSDRMNPVLRMSALRVEAPNGQVLVDNVSVTLAQGEVLGLIGESEIGKSTIGLAALCYARGRCRITGGEVWLAGENILGATPQRQRALRATKVAYVAQSAAAAFNPALTIGEQVCEGPLRHGLMGREEARAWSRELFASLDLPDPDTFGRRYPHQVSGGQLQRAMVAMAMSCKPGVLVLDEPTTALDVTTQIEVLVVLRRIVREFGAAALYITHDLAVVAQVADRIMVLRGGRMVEEGTTDAVLNAPREEYTRRLVAERSARSEEHTS